MALGPAWAALPVRSGGSCGLLVSRTSTFHDRWTETPWSAQRPKPRARGRRHRHDRGLHEVRAVCGLAFMRHGRVARGRLPNSNVAAWSSRAIPLGLPHSTPGWPGSGRCPRDENLADMSASLGRQGHQAFHCQPFLRGSFSDLMHAVMIQPRIARRLGRQPVSPFPLHEAQALHGPQRPAHGLAHAVGRRGSRRPGCLHVGVQPADAGRVGGGI